MAVAIVMPALEMAQETGVLVRWIKKAGEAVAKGEPLMEVETDKTTVDIESTAAGTLGGVIAAEGDVVPVGQTIAWILGPGEQPPEGGNADEPRIRARAGAQSAGGTSNDIDGNGRSPAPAAEASDGRMAWAVTPLARNVAAENDIDLSKVKPTGNRIEKADVLAYMQTRSTESGTSKAGTPGRLLPASPKARTMAEKLEMDLRSIEGSGPEGAVIVRDVMQAREGSGPGATYQTPGSMWRIMAERMSQSWTTVPHFYLMRDVDATRLLEWRERTAAEVERRSGERLTLTDLLVRGVAITLRSHPRLNSAWADGSIRLNREVNVGIAVALEEGLVVPVITRADEAALSALAGRRRDLISRAKERKLKPEEISNGTFTITNLGMYNVDAFCAIVNPPQAAILAVGRISERVVPVDGAPAIRPFMTLTLSCDHRVVDGATAAKFLDDLSSSIQDPWRLMI